MALIEVKVRRVGDSLVVTIPRSILSETGIGEGDIMILEPIGEKRVIVHPPEQVESTVQRLQLEIEVELKRKQAMENQRVFRLWEYDMGTLDQDSMQGGMSQLVWEESEIEVVIAEKRLEIFKLTGLLAVSEDNDTGDDAQDIVDDKHIEPNKSYADVIRENLKTLYFDHERNEGSDIVKIRVGDFLQRLPQGLKIILQSQYTNVCQAMRGKKLLNMVNAEIISESGPPIGGNTEITYRLLS